MTASSVAIMNNGNMRNDGELWNNVILSVIFHSFSCDDVVGVVFCFDYTCYVSAIEKCWYSSIPNVFTEVCCINTEPCSVVCGVVQSRLF